MFSCKQRFLAPDQCMLTRVLHGMWTFCVQNSGSLCELNACSRGSCMACECFVHISRRNPWNPMKANVKSITTQTKSWIPPCRLYTIDHIICFCKRITRCSELRWFCNGFHNGFQRSSWISVFSYNTMSMKPGELCVNGKKPAQNIFTLTFERWAWHPTFPLVLFAWH